MSRLIEATAAIELIRASLDENGPTPPTNAATLLLDRNRISTMAAIFQPRDRDRMYVEDKRHVASLADAIGNPGSPRYLDPITVWWGGDRWYVIDGHHRLDAYAAKGVREALPCEVFNGSLDEAMAYSGFANSKDRMPMTKTDKLNYAWRLVLLTRLSKSKIAAAASVAPRTVTNMREVRRILLENPENTVNDLIEEGWKRSDLRSRGVELTAPDVDAEEALKHRANIIRERLYKALGNKPHTDPEAFALALLTSDERLPASLMQTAAWREAFRDTIEALSDEIDADAADAVAAYLDGSHDY